MPRAPSELDMIEHHLQAAAAAIRDSRPGDLEVEQLRTAIYDHVYKAIEICATYAFTRPESAQPRSPLTSPSGRGGGVGGRGRGAADRSVQHVKDLVFDLDLLK